VQRGALVALVVGGLVLGASTPTLAATSLGSKRGASCGCTEPPGPRPAPSSASGSQLIPGAIGVVALGRKPGVSPGSGGIREGHLLAGEAIPQSV
jgi:hypothetical protein